MSRKKKPYAFSKYSPQKSPIRFAFTEERGEPQIYGGARAGGMSHLAYGVPLFPEDISLEEKKGKLHGTCNMSSCLSPDDVEWYNHGSLAYYCGDCARVLNYANFDSFDIFGHDLCTHYEEG